jgi:hypothetical protein
MIRPRLISDVVAIKIFCDLRAANVSLSTKNPALMFVREGASRGVEAFFHIYVFYFSAFAVAGV